MYKKSVYRQREHALRCILIFITFLYYYYRCFLNMVIHLGRILYFTPLVPPYSPIPVMVTLPIRFYPLSVV